MLNKDSLVYSVGEENRQLANVSETSVRKVLIQNTSVAGNGAISHQIQPQQSTNIITASNHDQFITAAKKPLTLHHGQLMMTNQKPFETELKTNYQDFHTYLQTVTKSPASPLEYTLNEHSEDNGQIGIPNPSGKIVEAQVTQFVPSQQQQPVVTNKMFISPSGGSEERKIVTVQSSLLSSKSAKQLNEVKPEPSRVISENILKAETKQQPATQGLPPRPAGSKESKPKEVSRNRLTAEEANKLAANMGQQQSGPQFVSQASTNPFAQTLDQNPFTEQPQKFYMMSPPIKEVNPTIQPPTLQRLDQASQGQGPQHYPFALEQTASFAQHASAPGSEQHVFYAQPTAHSQTAAPQFAQDLRPSQYQSQQPEPAPKIEPVVLQTFNIPPRPTKKDTDVRTAQTGPAISVAKRTTESEVKYSSQRSSSSVLQTASPQVEVQRVIHEVDVTGLEAAANFGPERVHYLGEVPIIENKPYIFDELGNKIYVDSSNFSQYAKVAKRAPQGALIQQLPPSKGQAIVADHHMQVTQVSSLVQTQTSVQSAQGQKSSIVPGMTAVVSLNGVQTAVRYTQADDGRIIAIPLSNSNPQGLVTEGIRQSFHKPALVAKAPVVEHHNAKANLELESKQIVIHQELNAKDRKHRSRRDKKDRHGKRDKLVSEDTQIPQRMKRVEYYPAEIPEGYNEVDEEYSYSSRSRSRSHHSVKSKSKTRRSSKHDHGDSSYHALKIQDQPIRGDNYHSSSGFQHHGYASGYSSNYVSHQADHRPYSSKGYDTG